METLVRDYVTRHPADTFLVAFALLQQGRVDEALNIAEESWPKAEVAALAGGVAALIAYPGLTPAQIGRIGADLARDCRQERPPGPAPAGGWRSPHAASARRTPCRSTARS